MTQKIRKRSAPFQPNASKIRIVPWIMEATSVNGQTARLANYRKMHFHKCRINHKNPLLKPKNRGIMIQKDRVISTPSLPNKTRDGFVVAYGSKMPLLSKSICSS
ncbi:hypothetical protein [Paenibacillus thiaminolyticus]|uniref:hypothetical protein n=1 Tax=Paenibacillus thiaminolyticus TaxID=49283 RepID=UPI0025428BC8|nr:hypothetical protein [Paenibacillus thiaminolyticus]WII39992.1 hypothetical protein O0V01_13275 [Paenibacillus thiaminolyticus]